MIAGQHKTASPYDAVAERYDQTRGGEERGDRYAAELHARLPDRVDPLLEIGVGTGVVALGLRRRGHRAFGIDMSAGMLSQARRRLDGGLVRGDACRLPVRDGSVVGAVSVWMVQAVADPPTLFREVYRVLRPGGRFLVCPTNRPAFRDSVGIVLARMFLRLDALTAAADGVEQRPVVDESVIARWGVEAGFRVRVEQLPDERWQTRIEDEIRDIEQRTWAPLTELNDAQYEQVAGPALASLREMKPGLRQRRAVAQVVILAKPGPDPEKPEEAST
jgi:ubiquinone/menaquinone biosynthesis C-methylase UbiE